MQTKQGEYLLADKEVYATDIRAHGLSGTRAVIHAGGEQFAVEIPLAGEHNVYNALAAVCVGRQLGMTMEEIRRGILSVQTIGGRNRLIQSGGVTIIDDCYNANPVSMKASIDVLSGAPGRRIAVLGDMGELGADEKALHAMVGEYFAGKRIDLLFCAGTLSEALADAARGCSTTEVYYFRDKEELIQKLAAVKKAGDTILVKASHFMGFGEIVRQLTGEE